MDPTRHHELTVEEAATAFESALASAGSLGRCLEKIVDLGDGRILSSYPLTVERRWVLQFRVGGIAHRPPPKVHLPTGVDDYDFDHEVRALVRDRLRLGHRVLIVRDPIARPTDNRSGYEGPGFPPFFFVGTDEVYHLVSTAEPEELCTWALRNADRGWGGVGIITEVDSEDLLPQHRQTMSEYELCRLVTKAEMVLRSAYDMEGWLVWAARSSNVWD